MVPKAILFDLHGTVAFVGSRPEDEEISALLLDRGYEVSPQQLKAAWSYVSFIDYPKHGYGNWHSWVSQVLRRIGPKVDRETLEATVELLESQPYRLYPETAKAIQKAKERGFKTAIVTTIARFKFENAIDPIARHLDLVMTGYEAGCDKSNPRMYRKVLEVLGVRGEDAVMIGDDLKIDVLLPKRLGMRAVLLDREGKMRSESRHADALAHTLDEAVDIAVRLHGGRRRTSPIASVRDLSPSETGK
ncbi:MAG: HAD family hydrolase [Acidobacteriota bacterium]